MFETIGAIISVGTSHSFAIFGQSDRCINKPSTSAFVAVLFITNSAGVRQVADIGADAYDAADGFYGEHEAGIGELNSAGFGFAEQAEQLGLL